MHNGSRSAVLAMLFVASTMAVAQDPGAGRFGAAEGCNRENSSRLPARLDCGEAQREPIRITTEVGQLPVTVKFPEIVITDCEAAISLEYTQRGAIARVEGTIVNDMCPASAGSFVVAVRTSNDLDEDRTQEYPETWQRTDDQPVSFSKDYAIGDDVDLVRVRALKSTCKCATPE